jgi:hypothetical protein
VCCAVGEVAGVAEGAEDEEMIPIVDRGSPQAMNVDGVVK